MSLLGTRQCYCMRLLVCQKAWHVLPVVAIPACICLLKPTLVATAADNSPLEVHSLPPPNCPALQGGQRSLPVCGAHISEPTARGSLIWAALFCGLHLCRGNADSADHWDCGGQPAFPESHERR